MSEDEKYKTGDEVYCIDESCYEIHLTKRKKYYIHEVDVNSKEKKLRIKGDLGKLVWLSDIYFSKDNQPEIQSIHLDDKIANAVNECIEVTITFTNNHRRCITFMTTQYLKGLVEKQNFIHSSKIVYVNLLNPEIVKKTIRELDKNNDLFTSTIAY